MCNAALPWLEPHRAAERDQDDQEREHNGAGECDRDVQGREGEQHVLVEDVLGER